ncbi:MAG: hypothetical protein ABSF33_11055 [Acidimicrobiales bacterium]
MATASGKFFEHLEELEHAGEGRPVAIEIGTIRADPALDSAV